MTLDELREAVGRLQAFPGNTPVFTRWSKGGDVEPDISVYDVPEDEFTEDMRYEIRGNDHANIIIISHG